MSKKALTVIVDEPLYRDVKAAAASSGKKMAEWISDAFRAALNGSEGLLVRRSPQKKGRG